MEDATQIITPLLPTEEEPTSLLDQLAAKRRDVSENRETLISVPGYDNEPPLLLIKYRLLEGPEIERIGRRIRADKSNRWDRQVNAMLDLMAAATLGVYVDINGDGEVQQLTVGGDPINQFTTDLAKGLKFDHELPEPATTRNVILGLFGNNDLAIAEHVARLNRWFSDTSSDVSETFLGGNL